MAVPLRYDRRAPRLRGKRGRAVCIPCLFLGVALALDTEQLGVETALMNELRM